MQNLNLQIEPAISPGKPFAVKFYYQNIDNVWLKIVKVPQSKKWQKQFEEWRFLMLKRKEEETKKDLIGIEDTWKYKPNGSQIIEQAQKKLEKGLFKSKAIVKTTIKLEKEEKEQSSEYILEGLQNGEYAILLSDNQYFKNPVYEYFTVTNINWIVRKNDENGYDLHVFERASGRPLSGVKMRTFVFNCPQLFDFNFAMREDLQTYTSNEKGFICLLPEDEFRRKVYLEFFYDEDKLKPNNYLPLAKIDYVPDENNRTIADPLYTSWCIMQGIDGDDEHLEPVSLSHYDFDFPENPSFPETEQLQPRNIPGNYTYLFTDRIIYRPENTIHFKGIICKFDGYTFSSTKNKELTVQLLNPKNEVVDEIKCTSNQFGSFSGEFKTTASVQTGKYKISTFRALKSIHIEEYKSPTFKVDLDLPETRYSLEDELIISGSSISMTGIPISDAKVNCKIIRIPKLGYNGHIAAEQKKTFELPVIRTDGNGNFQYTTKLHKPTATIKYIEGFTFQILVSVTDINGETQGDKEIVFVKSNGSEKLPKKTTVEVKNINLLNKKLAISFNDEIFGSKTSQKGSIQLFKLTEPSAKITKLHLWKPPTKPLYTKTEWYNKIPGFEYQNEGHIEALKKGEQVGQISFDCSQQVDYELNIEGCKQGRYVVEVVSESNIVLDRNYFVFYHPDEKVTPFFTPSFVETVQKPQNGLPGKYLLGTSVSTHALIELLVDDKLSSREYLQLNNEQKLLEVEVSEKYNKILVSIALLAENQTYLFVDEVYIHDSQQLKVEFLSFKKDLQPGHSDTWKLRIRDKQNNPVEAELLATLYDSSIDLLAKNEWGLPLPKQEEIKITWNTENYKPKVFDTDDLGFDEFAPLGSAKEFYIKLAKDKFGRNSILRYNWITWLKKKRLIWEAIDWSLVYPQLLEVDNFVGEIFFCLFDYNKIPIAINWKWYWLQALMWRLRIRKRETFDWTLVYPQLCGLDDDFEMENIQVTGLNNDEADIQLTPETDLLADIEVRTFFSDTVFFVPHLQPDDNGEVELQFTMPEQLTKWQMRGLVHTKNMQYSLFENILTTSKPLMLIVNAPRFFREGDEIYFHVKISNTTNANLEGNIVLQLFDVFSDEAVECVEGGNSYPVDLSSNLSIEHSWLLKIDGNHQALKYKVGIAAGGMSDGEERVIPVLKDNFVFLSKSKHLQLPDNETYEVALPEAQKVVASDTAIQKNLAINVANNQIWEMADVVSKLIDYPYGCVEQKFSIYYSSKLAIFMYENHRELRGYIDKMASTVKSDFFMPGNVDSFLTYEKKHYYRNFLRLDKIKTSLDEFEDYLAGVQKSNGGIPWFKGGDEDLFITQHIVASLGSVRKKGTLSFEAKGKLDKVISLAIKWLTKQPRQVANKGVAFMDAHYLFALSFFIDKLPKRKNATLEKMFDYVLEKWQKLDIHCLAMVATALNRFGHIEVCNKIIEHLLQNREQADPGIHWASNKDFNIWYVSHSYNETHTILIDLFTETKQNEQLNTGMKQWLWNKKKDNAWGSTKSTVAVLSTLFSSSSEPIVKDGFVKVYAKEKNFELSKNDLKAPWQFKTQEVDFINSLDEIVVHQTIAPVISFGVDFSYYEHYKKVEVALETEIRISKQLFDNHENKIESGSTLEIGKEIIVRLTIQAGKSFQYVHIKDNRPSGSEPVDVFSGYKKSDRWLSYYEEVRDTSTNFFISDLWSGSHTIEYKILTSQKGKFATGIAQLQCMYAPEIMCYSDSLRIEVV